MQPLVTASARIVARLRTSRGQGTVEYVGIVLAVGALLLALGGILNHDAASAVGRKVQAAVVHAIETTMGQSDDPNGGTH
jgi:hypothetical protein